MEGYLRQHVLRMHVKKFQCDKCPTSCAYQSELDHHIKQVHEGLKPFKCEKFGCKKAFGDKQKYQCKIDDREQLCPIEGDLSFITHC